MFKYFILILMTIGPINSYSWDKVMEDHGIKVYKKLVPGSDIVGFRGETYIYAEAEKVLAVLMGNEHRKEWVDRLLHSEILERVNNKKYIVYQIFELPWPLQKRDFVYQGVLTKNKKLKSIDLVLNSIEHPKAPKTVGVRAHLTNSLYRIVPMGKFKTKLEVEILSDPKGWIPTFVVNLVQKSWPYKTLSAIKKQVEKPHVGIYPIPK